MKKPWMMTSSNTRVFLDQFNLTTLINKVAMNSLFSPFSKYKLDHKLHDDCTAKMGRQEKNITKITLLN